MRRWHNGEITGASWEKGGAAADERFNPKRYRWCCELQEVQEFHHHSRMFLDEGGVRSLLSGTSVAGADVHLSFSLSCDSLGSTGFLSALGHCPPRSPRFILTDLGALDVSYSPGASEETFEVS